MDNNSIQPLVSAIILTHNRLHLLPRAIQSVKAQTYQNIECIVVNDASNDGTSEYCLSRRDIIFIDIPKEGSRGANFARNAAIFIAKGEYLAFLDDDDYWLPSKIEKQVRLAEEQHCDVVSCCTRAEHISEDGQLSYIDWPCPDFRQIECLSRFILSHFVSLTSQLLLRRSAVVNAGLFDENARFWQEYELEIRMAQTTEFYMVNEYLLVYRDDNQEPGRQTNKYKPWIQSAKYIRRKHRKLYRALPYKEWLESCRLYWIDGLKRARKANKKFDAFVLWCLLKLSRIGDSIRIRPLMRS